MRTISFYGYLPDGLLAPNPLKWWDYRDYPSVLATTLAYRCSEMVTIGSQPIFIATRFLYTV